MEFVISDADNAEVGRADDGEIVASKARARIGCIDVRDGLPLVTRDAAAARVAGIGIAFAVRAAAADTSSQITVSAYCAIGSEFDPAPLLARLAAAGYRTCLPVITPKGQPLVFRTWSPGDPLVDRMWGIREPAPSAAVVAPDVLLVPLLAFDRAGWRLGYGGGYYDRTLARLRAARPTTAIGLAYDQQECDEVPRGGFDQPLDWVLTPSGPRCCADPR